MLKAFRAGLPCILSCLTVGTISPSLAQTPDANAEATSVIALEEVLVTAQKRTESLQDTPIALDAFSESDLEREGINNVGDLANNVPCLLYTSPSPRD